MSVSTLTQGGTPEPSVSPLGPSKQQPLPLDRALPTLFTYQDGASDGVPPPSESTHGRGNHNKETENLTASTARRLFKGKIQSPSPSETALEGTPVISAVAGRTACPYVDFSSLDLSFDLSIYLRLPCLLFPLARVDNP